MSKNWNCSYVSQPHKWAVDANQADTGAIGIRVYCINCPQIDCVPAPYTRRYLEESRVVAAEVLNRPAAKARL